MAANALIGRTHNKKLILIGLSLILLAAFVIALSIGQVHIPILDIVKIPAEKLGLASDSSVDSVQETVLLSIRLPRLLMSVLIGASLGLCGAALQGLFRNPLVEPGLIGVSSGSALAVVLLIVFGSATSLQSDRYGMNVLMPVFAFGGGAVTTLLVMRIGSINGTSGTAVLILSGVAINALAGALMGLSIFYANENQLRMFTFWTLGDLGGATWRQLMVTAPILILSAVGLCTYRQALNAFALGEAVAFHMGVDVLRTKRNVILLTALSVGTCVSMSGAIGFIGLVVPHLIRVAFQADNNLVLPASMLGGALLLILADLISRTIVAPAELPIGVVTALIGSPFFIYLLMRSGKRGELAA